MGIFAFVVLSVVVGAVWLWGTYSIYGWKTWGFRSNHRIITAENLGSGTRNIWFVLRERESPVQAVQKCSQAFETELLQDSLQSNCVAFKSAKDALAQQRNESLNCEAARATQLAYGDAAHAEIKVNGLRACR